MESILNKQINKIISEIKLILNIRQKTEGCLPKNLQFQKAGHFSATFYNHKTQASQNFQKLPFHLRLQQLETR